FQRIRTPNTSIPIRGYVPARDQARAVASRSWWPGRVGEACPVGRGSGNSPTRCCGIFALRAIDCTATIDFMGSRYVSWYVLPNVAEYWALLHSAEHDDFEAAIEDFLAPPRPTSERRQQNRPVSVDRRR